jgi:deferrochelatase/peroxidase EfeB
VSGGGVSRRAFLAGAGGAAVGGGLLAAAACGGDGAGDARFVPFAGAHQAGITLEPAPATALMAAFSVLASDREELRALLRDLSDEIAGLMEGHPPEARDPAYPPVDSGILGADPAADNLTVVVRWAPPSSTTATAWPAAGRASSCGCPSSPTTGWTPSAATATC